MDRKTIVIADGTVNPGGRIVNITGKKTEKLSVLPASVVMKNDR